MDLTELLNDIQRPPITAISLFEGYHGYSAALGDVFKGGVAELGKAIAPDAEGVGFKSARGLG